MTEYYGNASSDSTIYGMSSSEITAIISSIPGIIDKPIKLGTLAMLSVSSHRDKFPVSACSRVGPKGFTAGHSVIGGTLAFNTLNREAFTKITEQARRAKTTTEIMTPDALPGFDIVITCVNEEGFGSYSVIKGITILDVGTNYTVDNPVLMESYSYMAISRIPFQLMNGSLNDYTSETSTVAKDATVNNVSSSQNALDAIISSTTVAGKIISDITRRMF